MTDRTHPDSCRITTSGDVINDLHDTIDRREAVIKLLEQDSADARARITDLESQLAQRFDPTDLLDLIEAYAETAAALQAVKDALAAGRAAQQGVAYAALPEKYYLAGGEVLTWDAKQMHAFADATCALRASRGQASSQAGEYTALVCDYCGALTPDPWHSSGMLHGKMSKHIPSCDACAARGAAKAQAADPDGVTFRTAARLGLTLRFYGGCAQSGMPGTPSAYELVTGSDRAAAMREAVERASAVIAGGGESQRFGDAAQAAQQGVAYAALPEKYYLAGGEVLTWDAKQMHAFADATCALRASRGQASSQAGEYTALVCDYCGALTPDPWHSSGMLHGKMSKHIPSCDACAARGAAKAQAAKQQEQLI